MPLLSLAPTTIALVAVAVALIYAGNLIKPFFRTRWRTHLRNLPGPKSQSWFSGNLTKSYTSNPAVAQEQFRQTYGTTYVYRGFLNAYRLCTFDTRALHHILNTPSVYEKPALARNLLADLMGRGLITAEGEQHQRQRRVMNPAFGNAQLRGLTEIFLETSAKLRDIWLSKTAEAEGAITLNSLPWLTKATLDIIGKGGFGYEFHALDERGTTNELGSAFSKVFSTAMGQGAWTVLRRRLRIAKFLPNRRERETKAARATMDRIGRELIADKKRALAAGEKGAGRDLLSLLMQANMDKDLPDHLRMSDDEVLGQVPTFLVAGHETTSTATAWCLFQLGQHSDIQSRLRAELSTLDSTPSMEQLNSLAFLEAVVRETLRINSVVQNSVRVAVQDDSIPLSAPVVDRNGTLRTEIKVVEGDQIWIPILPLNREREIWGEDHLEFKPERWLIMDSKNATLPGVFGGLLTFLGGPHSCIGYKFAVLEMKALLFHLIRSFKIELAVPPEHIQPRHGIVTRPTLKETGELSLPVIVTVV